MTARGARASEAPLRHERSVRPLLTVVVPVYNQAGSIVENVEEIRRRVVGGLTEPVELVVVSDGSIDRTAERLLAARSEAVRVIHYDRNLGKGYAVKAGALAARGEWIAFVDADLDLDPASIPIFLSAARRDSLDFAIGSKRHPDSVVHYPRSRRVSSWLYQQLVRLLFRLDVRDTQVGLKIFRREVAEEVVPFLLVKQFAFDLELLAVARAFGFRRIRELPIRLEYQFRGSGVRSVAVLRALIDTAAIFYRLRILRTYQRKRELLGQDAWQRAIDYRPLVSVITSDRYLAERFNYEPVELLESSDEGEDRMSAARRAHGNVIAFLARGAIPATNWLESTVPFLETGEICAVVNPTMAPTSGPLLERTAGAVWESRLGGGSQHMRFSPGNLRIVRDFPAENIVIRRDTLLASAKEGDPIDELCARLSDAGRHVLYSPETMTVASRPPLLRPHIAAVIRHASARAAAIRRLGWRAVRMSTLAAVTLPPALLASAALLGISSMRLPAGVFLSLYVAGLGISGLLAGIGFRSPLVGFLTAPALLLTHFVYSAVFLRAFTLRRELGPASTTRGLR